MAKKGTSSTRERRRLASGPLGTCSRNRMQGMPDRRGLEPARCWCLAPTAMTMCAKFGRRTKDQTADASSSVFEWLANSFTRTTQKIFFDIEFKLW